MQSAMLTGGPGMRSAESCVSRREPAVAMAINTLSVVVGELSASVANLIDRLPAVMRAPGPTPNAPPNGHAQVTACGLSTAIMDQVEQLRRMQSAIADATERLEV
jgi:hypothetical protein